MKQMLCFALIVFAGSGAALAAAERPATRTTAKDVEHFAQCFVRAQDSSSRAWSFVPRESGGGTFSNAGARDVRHPYFLEIADRGATREIRLMPSGNAPVLRAVDGCI
jgi:hypothetical protein